MTCFLAIGECMIEMAPDGGGSYAMGFAGDTFNTAWYARRLLSSEYDVAYLTAVGDDDISRTMVGFMRGAGIIPEVREIPGRTVGLYLVRLADGERSFSYWRDTSAARCLADGLERLPRVESARDVAYVSGITVAILPPEGREALLSSLADARAAGVTVAFDPNMRPRLWSSLDEMREWITKAARVADIALPSFEDEATHFADPSIEATADRYRACGATRVIVKNGAGTVLGIDEDGALHRVQPQPLEEIVDTTAAGNSFNAAALASLLAGEDFEAAIVSGCQLAATVVTRRGALVL